MIMHVDPWKSVNTVPINGVEGNRFEDDFVRNNSLLDSEAYVAILERKLAKIKRGKPHTEKALLESLEDKRRDCIVRLLAEDFSINDNEPISEEDIPTKWLRSYLNPQQPLTVGELVELVKADYLAKTVEEQDPSEEGNVSVKHLLKNKTTMSKLRGKKAFCVITGASQGIGRTIALELCKIISSESEVKLIARSKGGLKETANAIESINRTIHTQCISQDLSEPVYDSFKAFVSPTLKTKFDIYILIHNAGSEGNGSFTKDMCSLAEWQKYMSMNLFSMTLLTSAFLGIHKEGHRLIVNITSLAAIQPFKSLGYYCIGKAAREMYMRTLAEENKDLDILNYSPGPVETDMIDRVISCAQDEEVKNSFISLRDKKELVKLEDTVQKLILVLEQSKYSSGSRVDYFDK